MAVVMVGVEIPHEMVVVMAVAAAEEIVQEAVVTV
jgi:hypothetical protein